VEMPLPSLVSFPPPPSTTALLHLLAHPALHPEKSDAETEARLDQPGLFLIRTLPDSSRLFISLRVEKSVQDFEITVSEDPAPFVLCLSSHRFESLDELIGHATKAGFAYRGEMLRMERCILRERGVPGDRESPLGHWEHARLVPRVYKKRFSDDCRLRCSLLAPPGSVSKSLSNEELEELVKMKHDSLLHLDDYTRLSDSALLLKFAPFEISLGAYLRAHENTSIVQRLEWIVKVISAVSFITDPTRPSTSCSLLLTGETLVLQDTDCLQLKLVHLGGEVKDRDHWRWMAPEVHSSAASPSSLVWQMAVLIWQTFTNFSLLPFEQVPSLRAFLACREVAHLSGLSPFLVLPHSLTEEQKTSHSTKRYVPNYASMSRFPAAPDAIKSLFSSSLIFSPPEARLPWSTLSRTANAEYKIAQCSKSLDKLMFWAH
ncbi:hypothetical protein PMAYCL1PPCAC_07909, partial [Pristionchus mayeri]